MRVFAIIVGLLAVIFGGGCLYILSNLGGGSSGLVLIALILVLLGGGFLFALLSKPSPPQGPLKDGWGM